MKSSRILRFLCPVIFLFVLAGCGQDTVDLRADWEEGDSFRYVQTTDQVITQTFAGREQRIEQKQVMTFLHEVVETSDENQVIRITNERIQQDQTMRGREFQYDSEEPEASNHPAAEPLQTMVGKSYELVLTPGGEVQEVRGLDEILDDVAGDSPRQAQMLKKQFGEESVKQMFNQMFNVHRNRKRAVGDEWSQEIELTRPMPIIMNLEYRVKSIEGDEATLSVNSTIEANEDAPPMKMGRVEMRYLLSGEQRGEIVFSRSGKYAKFQEFEQNFEGTVEIKSGLGGTQEVPVRIDGTYKIEGEKL